MERTWKREEETEEGFESESLWRGRRRVARENAEELVSLSRPLTLKSMLFSEQESRPPNDAAHSIPNLPLAIENNEISVNGLNWHSACDSSAFIQLLSLVTVYLNLQSSSSRPRPHLESDRMILLAG